MVVAAPIAKPRIARDYRQPVRIIGQRALGNKTGWPPVTACHSQPGSSSAGVATVFGMPLSAKPGEFQVMVGLKLARLLTVQQRLRLRRNTSVNFSPTASRA